MCDCTLPPWYPAQPQRLTDAFSLLQGNAGMTRMRNTLYSTGVLVLLYGFAGMSMSRALTRLRRRKPTFAKDVAPLIKQYCGKCHGATKPKGGLTLDGLHRRTPPPSRNAASGRRSPTTLRSGDMPPPGKPRPNADELDAINAWLDAVVFQMDCNGPPRSRPRHHPPAQPRRVQQHHPRPGRRRLPAGRRFPRRRRRLRLRQHRRRAVAVAAADGEVPGRRREDRREGVRARRRRASASVARARRRTRRRPGRSCERFASRAYRRPVADEESCNA